MAGEREGKAVMGCELGAESAGAEEPDRDIGSGAGDGGDVLSGGGGGEIGEEFFQEFGEVVAGLAEGSAEGSGGESVGAGGAADAEIDAAGE